MQQPNTKIPANAEGTAKPVSNSNPLVNGFMCPGVEAIFMTRPPAWPFPLDASGIKKVAATSFWDGLMTCPPIVALRPSSAELGITTACDADRCGIEALGASSHKA